LLFVFDCGFLLTVKRAEVYSEVDVFVYLQLLKTNL